MEGDADACPVTHCSHQPSIGCGFGDGVSESVRRRFVLHRMHRGGRRAVAFRRGTWVTPMIELLC